MSPSRKPAETKTPTTEKETEEEGSHEERKEEKAHNEKALKEIGDDRQGCSGGAAPQGRKMKQMYLDFGQKHFDWKVCPQCEMMYTPGIPQRRPCTLASTRRWGHGREEALGFL